jgi:hypothetical protein
VKRTILTLAFALSLCTSMFAQSYNFKSVVYPDPNVSFTQLLGINNTDVIAGYHNFNTNQGFTLVQPNAFSNENFPNSAMTQVIGINNNMTTDGFYVDQAGVTHGFFRTSDGTFKTVDYPAPATATSFNQLLSQNDVHQAAGYYSNSIANTTPDIPYVYDEVGGVFHVITIPGAAGGAQATGINNSGTICGFFIDANGVNHGWLSNRGIFMPLDFPGSTGTPPRPSRPSMIPTALVPPSSTASTIKASWLASSARPPSTPALWPRRPDRKQRPPRNLPLVKLAPPATKLNLNPQPFGDRRSPVAINFCGRRPRGSE